MKVKRYKKFLFATSFVVAFFSLWFLSSSIKKAVATTTAENKPGIFKKMSVFRKQNERMFIGMANGEKSDLAYYDVYLNDGKLVERSDVVGTKNSIMYDYSGLPKDLTGVTYSVLASADGTKINITVYDRKNILLQEYVCIVALSSCEKASLITEAQKISRDGVWNAWDSQKDSLFGRLEKDGKTLFAYYSADSKKAEVFSSYKGVPLTVLTGSLSQSLRSLVAFDETSGKVFVFSPIDLETPTATYESKVLGKVTSVAWSPDEEFFAYSTESMVTVINKKSGKVTSIKVATTFGQKEVHSDGLPLVISSSGRYILFVDYYQEGDENDIGKYVSVLKSIDLSAGGKTRELLRSRHIELFPHQYR